MDLRRLEFVHIRFELNLEGQGVSADAAAQGKLLARWRVCHMQRALRALQLRQHRSGRTFEERKKKKEKKERKERKRKGKEKERKRKERNKKEKTKKKKQKKMKKTHPSKEKLFPCFDLSIICSFFHFSFTFILFFSDIPLGELVTGAAHAALVRIMARVAEMRRAETEEHGNGAAESADDEEERKKERK
jgi:hypothetical protein